MPESEPSPERCWGGSELRSSRSRVGNLGLRLLEFCLPWELHQFCMPRRNGCWGVEAFMQKLAEPEGAAAVQFRCVGNSQRLAAGLLIKQGAHLPLLLIFMDVIGGLIGVDVVGSFVGPVVLAVAHTSLVDLVSGKGKLVPLAT